MLLCMRALRHILPFLSTPLIPHQNIEHSPRSSISMLEEIVEYARAHRATDIHISPEIETVSVRIRVDGFLEEYKSLPISTHASLVARIKILSGLRIDQRNAPQDGRFTYPIPDQPLNIRVSVTPAHHGENIVLRILGTNLERKSLQELGCSALQRESLKKALSQKHGLVLATGPTGSGKTTLLYSLISMLDSTSHSIATLEDPIEYPLAGINQIPVGSEYRMSFSNGLRSVLRQDPDIIMIGEIRDSETAALAIHAALTGHLVLSTLHTQDAQGAIPRLVDMSIPPYLISATLRTVVAMRLARRICLSCRREDREAIPDRSSPVSAPKKQLFYIGTGCDRCRGTGVSGRIGIFEVLEIEKNTQMNVLEINSTIESHRPINTLESDALAKAQKGIISFQEMKRISYE